MLRKMAQAAQSSAFRVVLFLIPGDCGRENEQYLISQFCMDGFFSDQHQVYDLKHERSKRRSRGMK
jgi:hypothetical protein